MGSDACPGYSGALRECIRPEATPELGRTLASFLSPVVLRDPLLLPPRGLRGGFLSEASFPDATPSAKSAGIPSRRAGRNTWNEAPGAREIAGAGDSPGRTMPGETKHGSCELVVGLAAVAVARTTQRARARIRRIAKNSAKKGGHGEGLLANLTNWMLTANSSTLEQNKTLRPHKCEPK